MYDNKNQIQTVGSVQNLRGMLDADFKTSVLNYFEGDKNKLAKFLSSVVSAVQRTPELLNCDAKSVINSFMTMAHLEFMPSDVSGEAYVLPYKNKAQFQLGYQGLVTLFYRAGAKSIIAEIVRKNDKFSVINGVIEHSPDMFSDRGEAIGAYVIIELQMGGKVSKVMSKKEIIEIGEKFSKSYFEYGTKNIGKYTPWNEKNDPELWMWKKTVMKQAAKLVPKNETIFKAIAEDNKESNIADRMEKAKDEGKNLTMGSLIVEPGKSNIPETVPDVTLVNGPTAAAPIVESDEFLIEESEKEKGTFNIYNQEGTKVFGGVDRAGAEKWVAEQTKK